ncbi:hypothetical protein CVIRNUC_001243 [Coccomyxa viridis]|uniref:Uncharacterized protein n=1 Tax=Coccomyxa viridis TaxID=1274662 RepID=A0AAV1HTI1_9CHLO|nr:hypothetical protein CVIRNUC_001243 [Coccomyxa viridis]
MGFVLLLVSASQWRCILTQDTPGEVPYNPLQVIKADADADLTRVMDTIEAKFFPGKGASIEQKASVQCAWGQSILLLQHFTLLHIPTS